jgi:phenylacetate-CoA ligase
MIPIAHGVPPPCASVARDADGQAGIRGGRSPPVIDAAVESRPWAEQLALDDASYREQLAYLFERSAFYRERLTAAGVASAADAGGLADIARLPLSEKRELRETTTPDNPFGAHLCVARDEIVRIYATSGTTGTPSYIPLTAGDLDNWIAGSARSYGASGVRPGQRIVSTYNAGPWVAGAALAALDRLGLCHVPVGAGNSERLVLAIDRLGAEAVALTPSYAAYLIEWADERGFDLAGSSVERLLVAGEPGAGEPAFRARLEAGWGATVTEALGIGDVGVSLWGECEEQNGMHLGARGFVHPELIDPDTGEPLEWVDGARGELVLTHLRHRAAPLLRFRTRDHVEVWAGDCACGRTAPRLRCIGRTDDMLIVRGVNVFPSAVREVVHEFVPRVSGSILVRPRSDGVKQDPPLPVVVELARDAAVDDALAAEIRDRLRRVLVVQTQVELVPFGTLERSDTKSKLVERSP